MSARNFFSEAHLSDCQESEHQPHLVTFRSCAVFATRNQKHGSMKTIQEHFARPNRNHRKRLMQPVAESVRHMVEADIADVLGVSPETKLKTSGHSTLLNTS